MPQPANVVTVAAEHLRHIERQFLGALLLDNSIWHHPAVARISAADFGDGGHAAIFAALAARLDNGQPCDVTLLCADLDAAGQLVGVGGYIAVAAMMQDTPGSPEAPFYAAEIRQAASARRVEQAAQRALARIRDGQDAETVYALLQADAEVALEGTEAQDDTNLWTLAEARAYVEPEGFHLLGDGLLTLGGFLGIAGPGGVGKSRWTLQVCMDMACGRRMTCGIPIRRGGRPTKILFLQVENNRSRLQADLLKQASAYTPEELALIEENLIVFAPSGINDSIVNFDDPAAVRQTIRKLKKVRPEVVVFDPWSMFSSAEDENNAAQTNAAIREIKRAVALGAGPDAAIVLVHHSKYGKDAYAAGEGWDSSAYARGSKALVSAFRAQINLIPGIKDSGDVLVIACGKCNDGRRFQTFAARLDEATMSYYPDPDFDLSEWSEEMNGGKKKGRPAKIDTHNVTACVMAQPTQAMGKKELAQALQQEYGISRTVAYDAISAALASRHLIDLGRGIVAAQQGGA